MAARLKKRHSEDIRAKIQSDRIIGWLQSGVFDEKFQGKDVDLTKTKVSAAIALLNKTLPNLSQTELSGDPERPVTHRIEQVIVDG